MWVDLLLGRVLETPLTSKSNLNILYSHTIKSLDLLYNVHILFLKRGER